MGAEFDNSEVRSQPKKKEFDNSGHGSPPHEPIDIEILARFFREAFLPNEGPFVDPSNFASLTGSRRNPGYLKTIHGALRGLPKENLRILDLASGDAPFLRKLFYAHTEGECPGPHCDTFVDNLAKKISYLAVNPAWPDGYRNDLRAWGERFNQCFESVDAMQADLTYMDDLEILCDRAKADPYDLVFLSNAWHELPVSIWSEILARIPELLAVEGKVLLLDLNNPMDLNDADLVFEKLKKGTSFWEADAAYLSLGAAKDLVRSMGFDDNYIFSDMEHDNEEHYWWVEATKTEEPDKPRQQRINDIRTLVENALKVQSDDWRHRRSQETAEIVKMIRKDISPYELIFSGLRYLCLCASECVRHENL